MACCKCCCGNANCEQGDQGKCCCGGAEGTCCTEEEYCCDGECQATPCTGACCDSTFGCTQTADEEACTSEGGEWLGLGVPCDPDPCGCTECAEVTQGTNTDIVTKNVRTYDCDPYDNTASDTDEPCDSFGPAFGPCSAIDGVPEQYDDCDCMTLFHQCTTLDYDLGVDENNNCCVATRGATTFRDYVYIFNDALCQWRLIYQTEPLVIATACNVSSAAPGCTAECPTARECAPGSGSECINNYDGCECNEFI